MTAFVVGLTGPIGAGKSTVADLLRVRGADVVDADAIVRDEQRRGQGGYAAIRDTFGEGVLAADGEIDRKKLAGIVFGDPAELARLEALMHPRVRARIEELRLSKSDGEVLVLEAIKIIGRPLEKICDRIWVVTAPRETLIARLAGRGVDAADAAARLGAQLSDADFRSRADVVLENTGDRIALEEAVDRAWRELKERATR